MFNWFSSPFIGNCSIDVKCSNHLCNKTVIVPAGLGVGAMVYCNDCRAAMSQSASNHNTEKRDEYGEPCSNCGSLKKHGGSGLYITCGNCGCAVFGSVELKPIGMNDNYQDYLERERESDKDLKDMVKRTLSDAILKDMEKIANERVHVSNNRQ